MPEIKEVNDKPSGSVPTLAERRDSQFAGGRGKGTNPDDTKLNECQDQAVDLRE
jgi:hypothetical protein